MAIPTSLTIDTTYGDIDDFSIYQGDEREPLNKANYLDFGDLVSAKDVEDNLGIDISIVPMFWGDMSMRDHLDKNVGCRWTVRLLRANIFDRDLQIPDPAFRVANALPILSPFLQKLTPCTCEDAEELHDTLKQSKLIVKGFGIDPNSREAVTVVVSSFTGQLSNWASDHVEEIV